MTILAQTFPGWIVVAWLFSLFLCVSAVAVVMRAWYESHYEWKLEQMRKQHRDQMRSAHKINLVYRGKASTRTLTKEELKQMEQADA